jgi:O-antigen/teichoic acid export membrane protein
MARGATVMVLLTLLASGVNYASNLVFSRVLSPVEFGDLTAILALAVIVAVPTAAAQTVIAERVARNRAEGRREQVAYFIRHALGHVVVVAAMVGVVYALAIPLVVEVLELHAPGPAIALLPLLVVMFIAPVALGVLQGMDRFIAFGLMTLAIAVSRIAFGVPWALAGGGPGELIRRGSGAATSGIKRRPSPAAISASGAFIAFAVISNLDILLAKIFLDSEEVGLYAALATLAKVVLFLPGAVAVVMVPNAARARHSREASRRVLRLAALLVLVTTLVAAVPAAVAPELVVKAMFGNDYANASGGVLPIVAAGAGLALLYLLVTYAVAIDDRRWTLLLVGGVLAQIAGIAAFHDSPTQVATVQAIVVLAVLFINELAFHSLVRPLRGR